MDSLTATTIMVDNSEDMDLDTIIKEETPWSSWPSISVKEEPDWYTLFDIDLPNHEDDELPNWLEQQTELPTLDHNTTTTTNTSPIEEVKVFNYGDETVYWENDDNRTYHMAQPLNYQQEPVKVMTEFVQEQEYNHHNREKLQDEILEFEMVLCNALTPPESPDIIPFMQEFTPNELDELLAERAEVACEEVSGGDSSSSSCGGCSPRSSSSGTEDPEWTPEFLEGGATKTSSGGTRRRKSGVAGVEEKRQRKKEQNRDAATRYRLKKKMEVEGILGEEKDLKRINKELKNRLGELTKESKYLKSLMRDLYKAKGLIK